MNRLKTRTHREKAAFFVTLFFLFSLATKTAHASNEFDEISITYKLRVQSSSLGDATLGKLSNTLRKKDAGYTVKSETKAQGFAALLMGNEQQECDFSMNDGYATPLRYVGGSLKAQKYAVDFNWQDKKFDFGNDQHIAIPEGYVLDICSMPFALALQKGQGLDSKDIHVVDGKKQRLRSYQLINQSKESIETPLGQRETLKIELQRISRSDRTLTFWLSTSEYFVPIKIEEKRSSRTTTMMVDKLDIQ